MVELQRGRNKKRFIYLQIADNLEQMITDGHYRPNDRLPSIEVLAKKFDVNNLTVVKAIKHLSQRGLVYSIPIRGTFVASASDHPVSRVGVISMVMVPGNYGYYHLLMLGALQSELSRNNISLVQFPSARMDTEKILKQIKSDEADAYILIGCFPDAVLKTLQHEFTGRLLLLDYSSPDFEIDAVIQDNENGVYQALSQLCPPGHPAEIAVIDGSSDQPVSAERRRGIRKAQQLNPELKVHELLGNYSLESGAAMMRKILAEQMRLDGIFCMNDEMAMGVLSVMNEHGIAPSEKLWLCGYDDILLSYAVNLSTIRAPIKEMVQSAVELLMRRLKQPGAPKVIQSFSPQIIWRKTAVPPAR